MFFVSYARTEIYPDDSSYAHRGRGRVVEQFGEIDDGVEQLHMTTGSINP